MDKLKILWIGPYNIFEFKDKFGLEQKTVHPAPWLTDLAKGFLDHECAELHIISSSTHIKKDYKIKNKNVYYYFLKRGIPFIKRGFPSFFNFDLLTSYKLFNNKVHKYIEKIRPDIVNLHGTEHAMSSAIFNLNIPVIITIQGFAHMDLGNNISRSRKRVIDTEYKIFKNFDHYIIRTKYMEEVIKKKNSNANFFYHYYPVNNSVFVKTELKQETDVIFAAEISKRKGIKDLINAIKIVSEKKLSIKVKIIGFHTREYLQFIVDYIKSLKLENNIEILGFLPKHEDVLNEIRKSKICVLPTYADTSPGTVAESMSLGIPVISYNVDGLPDMIKNNESGILVEKGNIEGLANAIHFLIQNKTKCCDFSKKAHQFAVENFSIEKIVPRLLKIYTDFLRIKN